MQRTARLKIMAITFCNWALMLLLISMSHFGKIRDSLPGGVMMRFLILIGRMRTTPPAVAILLLLERNLWITS